MGLECSEFLKQLDSLYIYMHAMVLSQYFGKPAFPVDTHIRRITRRLGYVKSSKYEAISEWWRNNTSEKNYVELHLLLITHGRKICKARNPRCDICPLKDICNYGRGKYVERKAS